MPELPEVEALADHLRRHAVGQTVSRVDVVALSVLKTFDPPPTALHGREVTGAHRWGKYLGLQAGELHRTSSPRRRSSPARDQSRCASTSGVGAST